MSIKHVQQIRKKKGNVNLIRNKKWEEHHKTLLTGDRNEFLGKIDEIIAHNQDDIQVINMKEVRKALRQLKSSIAPEPGDISGETDRNASRFY